MANELKIFPDVTEVFYAAAVDFTQRAISAVQHIVKLYVVLSGGHTAQYFFNALTSIPFCKKDTPWQYIRFFFADERYVPFTSPDSNYHLAHEYLFSKVPVIPENIYPMPTNYADATEAAKVYESSLRQAFNINEHEFPAFDLIYLGVGIDGHTASLMPFSDALMAQKEQLVTALWVPHLAMHRITLTATAINRATAIIVLVIGANKAATLRHILEGDYQPQHYPAQLIKCTQGSTLWYLDAAAAAELQSDY